MNIFELFGTIAVNNSNANKAISQTGKMATNLSHTVNVAFEKVGKFAINCGKTVAKGLAVGSAAIGVLMKQSVQSYAEYEQLVGGVETLFKNSASTVMKYADNAFKTAGLSANDYMSTVTSFSASLLQGLGGDTAAAAKMADLAITDMSDNANKMGTDMASIQNAYQGFAKQNYTMLDNLKLGYGGTATEMARLINDSGVLGEQMEVTEKTVNQVSFAKMIEAIHVIQTEMGITGTTAKEAAETISGSWNSTKAAWKNLIVGMADSSQDLDGLIDNFVNSAVNTVGNVTKIVPSISKGITKVIKKLTPQIPGFIRSFLPSVIEGGTELLTGLAMALPDMIDVVIDALPETLKKLGYGLEKAWSRGVWPLIQKLFKSAFNIELPKWHKFKLDLGLWWKENIQPVWDNVKEFIKDLGTLGTNIATWAADITGDDNAITDIATVAGTLLALHNPLLLLGGAVAVLAGNWGTLKENMKAAKEESDNWTEIPGHFLLRSNVTAEDPSGAKGAMETLGKMTQMSTGNTSSESYYQWLLDLTEKWENLKTAVADTVEEIGNFFSITIPNGFKTMCESVGKWINDHFVSPISTAIQKLKEFLGLDGGGEKTPTVYRGPIQGSYTKTYTSKGSFNDSANAVQGFATGLDFVPRDDFPAYLHYGEAVLTRKEADAWRKGNGNAQLAAKLDQMQDTFVQAMEAVRNQPVAIQVDSRAVAVLMAKEMTRSIGNRNIQTLMGMGG